MSTTSGYEILGDGLSRGRPRKGRPRSARTGAERQRDYRRRRAQTETTEQTAQRREHNSDVMRQTRHQFRIAQNEQHHSNELLYLGDRNNECHFCGALHFVGAHNCCNKGKVFLPPFRKIPQPLYDYYFNFILRGRSTVLNDILKYNALLSMGSFQYDRQRPEPHGVQSVKVRGHVHHFTSCVRPKNPRNPKFGNVYVYDVARATEFRMTQPTALHLKPDVLHDFGAIVEHCNPLAAAYKSMNEIIRDRERENRPIGDLRFKICDAHGVDRAELLSHPGVYDAPTCGNMIAVYFTCTAEQFVPQKGLMIYPKLDDHIPFPIYPYMPMIDAICFPLLHVYGEDSWQPGIPYMTDRRPFVDRMLELQTDLEAQNKEIDWSLERYNEPIVRRGIVAQMAEIEDLEQYVPTTLVDSDSDEEFDFVDENAIDNNGETVDEHMSTDANETANDDMNVITESPFEDTDSENDDDMHQLYRYDPNIADENGHELDFTEHGGNFYPQRLVVVPEVTDNRLLDDHMSDSGEEEESSMAGHIDTTETYERVHDDEQIQSDFDLVSMETDTISDFPDLSINDPSTSHDIQSMLIDSQPPINEDNFESVETDSFYDPTTDSIFLDQPATSIATSEQRVPTPRASVSRREWVLYHYQQRRGMNSRFSASRKLGQFYLIDHFTRILEQRGKFITEHFTETTRSDKQAFLNYMNTLASRQNRRVGALTHVPQHIPGSPRYLRNQFEKTVTMSNKLGHPDLFVTFTASSKWKELTEHIPTGETWADNPFLVAEVFKKKLDDFIRFVCGKRPAESKSARTKRRGENRRRLFHGGLFGDVKWFAYSIEFQQRGLPHAHIVISLADKDKPRSPDDIDRICQAELPIVPDPNDPTYEKQQELRDLVEQLMIHRPCQGHDDAYCRKNTRRHWRKCSKRFPKEYANFSRLIEDDYAVLRRPNNAECSSLNPEATNQYVVPYNKTLLMRYQAHINVEIISNLHVLKYLYKYLYKGFNRALIETMERSGIDNGTPHGRTGNMASTDHILYPKGIKLPDGVLEKRNRDAIKLLGSTLGTTVDDNQQPILVYNEVHLIEDMRALTSCEAAWEISDYEMHNSSHNVCTAYVHMPDREPLQVERGHEDELLQRIQQDVEEIPSMLKAWFRINRNPPNNETKALLETLNFNEMFRYFRYSNKKWIRKLRDNEDIVLTRVKTVHPRFQQLFAIRLLAMNQIFVKSFEELRTVNGVLCSTFVDAARQLGLMTDEIEWRNALEEAGTMELPINIRRLFASILIFSVPANPLDLWNDYMDLMLDLRGSLEQKIARALYHIRSILRHHGKDLSDFNLPNIISRHLGPIHDLDDDYSDLFLTPDQIKDVADSLLTQLNEEQIEIYTEIMDARADERGKRLFFLEGSGGCGKTFVYNTLYYNLRSKGYKVLCVAHTGVAAKFLPNGSTVHSAFGVPIQEEETMQCHVTLESAKAYDLRHVNVILWDEATMTDRRIYACVNRLFQALHPDTEDELFGGVMVIAGGDWKQTLPIVPEAIGEGVIDYTLKKTDMWPLFEKLQLTRNVRAQSDPAFAEKLLDIGNGRNRDETDQTVVPESILKRDNNKVIDFVFPTDQEWTKRSVLTVTNETSLRLAQMVLDKLSGDTRTYTSIDKPFKERSFVSIDPETYHSQITSGLPPHILNLKIGCEVMLLRNLNVTLGLCNGARFIIKNMTDHLLICEPVERNERTPETVCIHRMPLTSSDRPDKDFCFIRHQFPVRVSYSLTINKSQGGTLEKVGIVLDTPCFAHGQLYVALSRAHRQEDVAMHHYNMSNPEKKNLVHNVVYDEILR